MIEAWLIKIIKVKKRCPPLKDSFYKDTYVQTYRTDNKTLICSVRACNKIKWSCLQQVLENNEKFPIKTVTWLRCDGWAGGGAHRALETAPGPNSVRSLVNTFNHCGFFADIDLLELFALLVSLLLTWGHLFCLPLYFFYVMYLIFIL